MCRSRAGGGLVRSRGIAMVELMIGVAVGLMVIASALAASASLLQAAAAARDAADLQQRADMVMRLIGRQVRQAGSVRILPDVGGYRFSNAFRGWSGTGAAVSGVEGGPGKPDTLRVSYEPDSDDDRDGLGVLANKPADTGADGKLDHFDSQFFVATDKTDSGRSALYASGARPKSKQQALVAGVDDLQLQYGIPGADGSLVYVDADKLPTGTAVLAVAACIQVSSDLRRGTSDALDCNGKAVPNTLQKGALIRLVRAVFRVNNDG